MKNIGVYKNVFCTVMVAPIIWQSMAGLSPFIPTDQYKCICKQCRYRWDGSLRAGSLRAISSGLSFCYWFLTDICTNECVQIQRWRSPCRKLWGVHRTQISPLHDMGHRNKCCVSDIMWLQQSYGPKMILVTYTHPHSTHTHTRTHARTHTHTHTHTHGQGKHCMPIRHWRGLEKCHLWLFFL